MDRRPLALRLALLAALLLGAARPRAEDLPDPRPRVVAVDLVLPAGEDREAVRSFVAVAAGERLSTRALRRTVQRLYLTGRFRSVTVRALPAEAPAGAAGAWVRLAVEALPARRIERVSIRTDAPGALDEAALRATARLEPGEPFDEADLAPAVARIRAALARRGHRAAEVQGRVRGEAKVELEVLVAAGPAVRVRRFVLPGAPASAALEAALRTRSGAVLDADLLEADVRTLRSALREAGYRRARVSAPVVRFERDAADVEIPVVAGPRLSFAFRGNATVPIPALERQLGFEEDQPVDAPALEAAAERLAAFYRARGHADARVEVREVSRGGDLAVVFRIAEGLRYRLGEVRFEGTAAHGEAVLRARLAGILDGGAPEPETAEADQARALALSVPGARPPPGAPEPLAASAVWDGAAWDRAAELIVEGYRADGYLEAVYLGSSAVLDGARRVVDVTLRLREGPRTYVDAISFEGNRAIGVSELAHEARLAPGAPLAFEKVEETRVAILRRYLARGYAYAKVEAREDLERERSLARVRYVIEEGPQVRIGRVVVTGNRRTLPGVVRSALELREGAVYDPDALTRSQAALLRLGVFRSVNLRLQEPEVPQETKDLAVELAERPYATLTQGIGFSIANGPRAVLEYARPNLLGRAVELSARAKVNYPVNVFELRPDIAEKDAQDRVEGRADVGVRSARLEVLPFPAGARADVLGEILHRRAYDLRRVAGTAGLDIGFTSRVGLSLQYELEVDDIRRTHVLGVLTQADLERLRFDEGVTTLQTLRPSFSLDYRDSSTHPHRGWFAAGAAEYARSIDRGGGGRALFGLLPGSEVHTSLVKVSGTLSGYLPIGPSSVVALSLRGGRVFPLDGDSRTIIPKRFFLGGASSMRGYAEEEMIQEDVRSALAAEARACATSFTDVGCTERGRRIAGGLLPVSEGGEAFLVAKAELRVGLTPSIEAGLFVDLGNVWLDPQQYALLALRPNAGIGLRFVTPIGPAALDLGFNLQPDRTINERTFAPHFTIGLF
jgi:outer membrane protein insertion porin family